jgi:uncharacterized integral membrane protein
MVILYLVLGAFALLVIVLFSIQNAVPVTVWFYNWEFKASLAIVVFLSVLAGIVIEALFIASLRLRRSIRRRPRKAVMPEDERSLSSQDKSPPGL